MSSDDSLFKSHASSYLASYQRDSLGLSEEATYTTSNGAPVPHLYESQRAGENGPLLLQDFHLLDLLSHFNRERVPERVVHAKGSGAHGFFECTNPIPDLTIADIFSTKNKKCPVTVRFSTVGGEAGSHDCARDPRGFAVKFRTDEGNWDIVGNNTPVFFLRDPAKFPHFIHTQKRHPATHLASGDDSTMFWDYLCHNPESVHQLMILLGDRGIPDGYRKMHGYSGHTLKLINEKGDLTYCQIHFKSQQGTAFLTEDKCSSYSPDYAQRDLYEAIARGEFPKWSVELQTMSPRQAERLWEEQGINVFDLTHVWSQQQFPLFKVGQFTLNENAVNYFAEVEQAAFSPSHMPPGVEPSADPVLQSRLFAYPDTHRHRIGVNYQQLPVNAPKARSANFQRDGAMAFLNQGSRPNYLSSLDPIRFAPRRVDLDKTHGHFVGRAITFLSEIRPGDFNGPRALWRRVWEAPARRRFIANTAAKMASCKEEEFIRRQIGIFYEVDPEIAFSLEQETGVTGYQGIAKMSFNGTHNGMADEGSTRFAHGVLPTRGKLDSGNNGGPSVGTHKTTTDNFRL